MNIILLSGGSGKRLWPLSNDTRSKQFLKLLRNEQGMMESMLQRVYGQIIEADVNARVVIATGISQVDMIRSQLGDDINLVVEPERRDTFPAISLASAYLADKMGMELDEVVIVIPVDPYANDQYFETLLQMEKAVQRDTAELLLMGIKPTKPTSQYGYIVPGEGYLLPAVSGEAAGEIRIYPVNHFVEKPVEDIAEKLIAEGAVWNGGVFAFRLGYMLKAVGRSYGRNEECRLDYEELRHNYHTLKKISFDYEVVEKAASVAAIFYNGYWKDLGTWSTLTEQMSERYLGRVLVDEESFNTNVINELTIPVVVLGAKDMIVATSPDGILISDKSKSSNLKSYVGGLNDRPRYEEYPWGEYKVIDCLMEENKIKALTKHLNIKAGRSIAYQEHKIKDEVLTVLSGTGQFVLDGKIKQVQQGDVLYITRGQKHAVKADNNNDMQCIEVQIGQHLLETDQEECSWEWENNQVKVSIIVPVYNVERYLSKCLDSLIHQTLNEIEIIVVNDGATDGSQNIIEEYCSKSSKIRAYRKENGGLSDARNYGMKYATGEYIGFIDSDDYVEIDMFEVLYRKAKAEDSDIVECNLRHTYEEKEDIEIGKELYDKKELLMYGRSVTWNKIYKRDWLLDTKVEFPKGLVHEDIEFYAKLVPHIRVYSYVDEASVHYLQRNNSINNTSSLKSLDILKVLNNIYDYYLEHGYYAEFKEALEFLFTRILLCSSFLRICRIADKGLRRKALEESRSVLLVRFPEWKRNRYLKKTKSVQALYMKTVNGVTYRMYGRFFPFFYKLRYRLMIKNE